MSTPTVRGSTPAGTGITYIPVDRFQADLTVQADAVGTVTFTVDGTGDSILFNTATLAAANMHPIPNWRKDPADALVNWTNIIASGSADASATTSGKFRALRINITAGTGSVNYVINQGGGA